MTSRDSRTSPSRRASAGPRPRPARARPIARAPLVDARGRFATTRAMGADPLGPNSVRGGVWTPYGGWFPIRNTGDDTRSVGSSPSARSRSRRGTFLARGNSVRFIPRFRFRRRGVRTRSMRTGRGRRETRAREGEGEREGDECNIYKPRT